MKLTPSLEQVNSWTHKKTQKALVGTVQTLGKIIKKDFPRAMCEGTSCMSTNPCGWNCGSIQDCLIRSKRKLGKSINNQNCKQRAA